MNSFFEKNDILHRHQYGFRQKHSTVYALLHTVTSCYDAMNEKLFSSLIMVDLRKVFDIVCHKKVTKETIFKWSKIFFTTDKYRGASAIHFKATVKSYLRQ